MGSETVNTKRTRGAKWMAIRDRILRRDCGICQCEHCKATGTLKAATEVDHKRPLALGGTDDDDNLQAINAECHKRKTTLERGHRVRAPIGADGYPVEQD